MKLDIKSKLVELSVNDIIEYDNNNKIHWEKQIQAIEKSIERFSYIDEIVVDKNNVVLIWHWRLQAIKNMWYDRVEVKKLDINWKEWKALRYLHNKLAEYDSDYILENVQFEVESWVDFSLWDLPQEEFVTNLEFLRQENQEFNIKTETWETQTIKWIQIPVKQADYEELTKYVRIWVSSWMDLGTLLYNTLRNENDRIKKS